MSLVEEHKVSKQTSDRGINIEEIMKDKEGIEAKEQSLSNSRSMFDNDNREMHDPNYTLNISNHNLLSSSEVVIHDNTFGENNNLNLLIMPISGIT
jgi:hypothetical protein